MWLELDEYLERHEPVKLDPDQVLRHGFVAAEWAIPDLDIDDTGWNVDPAKQKWMEYQGDRAMRLAETQQQDGKVKPSSAGSKGK
ncbi:unnamed protein product [Lactuca virosa]|uniref:Uncharacterized protein n=1 Tax=Lactuca virosa TaxID=75947 RepID=A0AAU9P4Q8_9ASTR|nr:unnamed protein product [Lactuca virosa]